MPDDLIAQIKALRLYGMAQALAGLAGDPAAQSKPPAQWVGQMVEAERADRQARDPAAPDGGGAVPHPSGPGGLWLPGVRRLRAVPAGPGPLRSPPTPPAI